jgi:hypothetical protein
MLIHNDEIFLDGNYPIWYKIHYGMSVLGYVCADFAILRFEYFTALTIKEEFFGAKVCTEDNLVSSETYLPSQ